MSQFKRLISLFFFDQNEKKMINFFSNLNNKENNRFKKKKKILVSVINDYYWLCRVASAKNNEFKDYELIGYWPLIIKGENKSDNKFNYFLKKISRPLYYFLLKKKWFNFYKKIGVNQIITPEDLKKYEKK